MRWKSPAVLLSVVAIASSAVFGGELSRMRSLVEDGRKTEALSDLDEHLAQHPADSEAMFLRGLVLAETHREGEAREVFERLSELRPDRPEPLNNLAVVQAAVGDYDGAVETLKAALMTHPAYKIAYENLTKIYGQLASEAYSRALSVDEAHDRSAVELVLLSDMSVPAPAPVRVAQALSEPLPSTNEPAASSPPPPPTPSRPMDSDEAMALVEPATESPASAAEAPSTPDQAIEAALRQGRDAADRSQTEDAQPEPAGMDPEPEVASAEAAGASMPSAISVPADPAELAALVEAWAGAWSEQRVEDYLDFYGKAFRPSGDLSLEEWRKLRRVRVTAPEYVKVSVAFLDFENGESDRAVVRFNQSYESDTFGDVVTKTLELVRENGAWKIVSESVDS